MKVKARVYPIKNENSKTVAYANLTINDEIAVKGVKLVDSLDGLNFYMPSYITSQGYRSYCFPTGSARSDILNELIARYRFPLSEQDMFLVGKYEEDFISDQYRLTEYSDKAKQYVFKEDVDIKKIENIRKIYDLQGEAYKRFQNNIDDVVPKDLREETKKSEFKVSIIKNTANQNIKAMAKLIIDNQFVVPNIILTQGAKGEYITMPDWVDKQGKHHGVVYPVTAEANTMIKGLIIEKYRTWGDVRGNVDLKDLGTDKELYTFCGLERNYANQIISKLEKEGVQYNAQDTEMYTFITINKKQLTLANMVFSAERKIYNANAEQNHTLPEQNADKPSKAEDEKSEETADESADKSEDEKIGSHKSSQELIYRIEANPRRVGINDAFFVQTYIPKENGREEIGDVLCVDSAANCAKVVDLLESNKATPSMIKEYYEKQDQTSQEPLEQDEPIEM